MKKIKKTVLLLLSIVMILCVSANVYAYENGIDQAKPTIVKALNNVKTSADLSKFNITSVEGLSNMYFDLLNGNPKYFYVDPTLNINAENGVVTTVVFNYKYPQKTVTSMKNKYESAVRGAVNSTNKNMSAKQKVTAVNNYFYKKIKYDWDSYNSGNIAPDSVTAYGALVNKKAVCDGIAMAFKDVMTRLNIPCEVVISYEMNHAWNIVKIGETWLHTDSTWNISSKSPKKYLLLTDSEIANSHYNWSTSRSGVISVN